MKEQSELLKRTVKWLGQPGNSAAALAASLGYKTSYTVHQWVRRGNISKWQRDAVKEIIRSKK